MLSSLANSTELQKDYHHCILPLLVSAGRILDFRLGDKGHFARAVAAQCTGKNFLFTSNRKKSRSCQESTAGHTMYEPDILTPRPPAPPSTKQPINDTIRMIRCQHFKLATTVDRPHKLNVNTC
ncbi:hypothetical protein BsWGS_08937 [Bradybaena similaris]